MAFNDKFTRLKNDLNRMERVIIAYSGGVDSTLLLKVASLSGLREILAVTASSESLPSGELIFARQMTEDLDIRHEIIETNELNDKNYADNPSDRCYYCKKELFGKLKAIAAEKNFTYILDGSNQDDTIDWRPGRKAAAELGIHSPLMDAGFGKKEIRDISKYLGLPTWNKAATPCLSSRLPYGEKITSQALEMVEQAENFIKKFGIKELRVRHHAETARIEILPEAFPRLMDGAVREKIIAFLKSLGYKYVTLDLQGFRSGSLNE
ncbi:MAG TPA: ATP-dependent sacrificial sulfur transferase LarE [Nitrospirae bacterium]|nr:ATP-dependent sacrificial sulfur transferase LarE [Nitrospirota bacterium]